MNATIVGDILNSLLQIQEDQAVPRNVKNRIKTAIIALEEDHTTEVKIDKVLQELDEISDDPNLPTYTRTQIWDITSRLESNNGK